MVANIASIATAIGVLLAVGALRQTQRQRVRRFEDMYVARYWQIMDRLSLAALTGWADGPTQKADELAIWAYFRLCEDELELRLTGWISDSTWKIWSAGMRWQMQRWPFNELWRKFVAADTDRASGFDHLRKFMADPRADDPCSVPLLRRWAWGMTGRTSV